MPETSVADSDVLRAGLDSLALELDASRIRQLLAYRDELARWNRVHNLSGIRDAGQMVPVHLLDSLALVSWIQEPRLIDVGSGGGLPGLPLAIARPGLDVLLIEPRAKRASFLQHVVHTLGLDNVKVARSRAEDLSGAQAETVVTRAFGTLRAFVDAAAHLRAVDGVLLAAKGREPAGELDDLPPGWQAETVRIEVPGIDGSRHLVRLTPDNGEG